MELFNENKNRYFSCITNIINDCISGKELREEDIFRIFIKAGILKKNSKNKYENLDLYDKLLNKDNTNDEIDENLYILKEDNNGIYKPVLNRKIPISISTIELQWISMLIGDPKVKLFLSDTTIKVIKNKLSNVENPFNSDFFVIRNMDASEDNIDDENFINTIKVLIKSIKEKKFIKYTNIANTGETFKNMVAFPFTIEYSPKNNKFRVAVLLLNPERPIKMNISNIHDIEMIEEYNTKLRYKTLKLITDKKVDIPLILEIDTKRDYDLSNVIERCFFLFSCYEKEAYYDREEGKYIIKIYYYKFDEREIIKDILSLGSSVIVSKPDIIRNEIIERLKKGFIKA